MSSPPGPPGPPPDMSDTSSRQGEVIGCSITMLALASAAVALRFYSRGSILRVLGKEDWTILTSLIFSVGVTIGTIRQTFFALGKHAWLVSEASFKSQMMEQWYTAVFYALSLSFTKWSILFLYLSIFASRDRIRITTYIVLAIVTISNIWVMVTIIIACVPIQKVWNPSIPGWCLNQDYQKAHGILNVVTDFIILALPIPIVARLNMDIKHKVGLMFVFMLGFVICVVSIVRISAFTRLGENPDVTFFLATPVNWGSVEVNLAIICPCLIVLKPLIVRLFPSLGPSTGGTDSTGNAAGKQRGTGFVPWEASTRQRSSFSKMQDNSTASKDQLPAVEMHNLWEKHGTDVSIHSDRFTPQRLG